MKPRFGIAGWGLALLMVAGALVVPASRASAATIECKNPGQSQNPVGEVTRDAIPVVLVHGWDIDSKFMAPVKEGLNARLGNDVTLLQFDYKKESYHWAAHPNIASCLADYIHEVSQARVNVGGDPRVLVVTHSMGGLAARFATSSKFAANPADEEVAGVVTIGAPSLGSPFGNKLPTRALEIVSDIDAWPLPDPSTDGATCLALHDSDHPLPKGCKPGPYYDKSVPITQIGGNISVRRKLFGFNLYDINLGSDGIVGVDSSLGYVGSGPIGEKTPSGSKILQRRIDCTLPVSQVLDAAATHKLVTDPRGDLAQFVSSVGTTAYSDMAAMDQIGGSYESLQLMQLLIAANWNASCSHKNIVENKRALDDAAKALKVHVSKLQAEARARAEAAARAREAMKSYVGDWYRHRTLLTIKSDGKAIETGDLEIRSSQFTAQGNGFLDLPPKLVGTVQYVSDGTEYQIRAGSRIEFEMDTPQTLWVTYGSGTKRLQFCLDGVHVIGSECGA